MMETQKPETHGALLRAWRFLLKPWVEKRKAVLFRWTVLRSRWESALSRIPIPIRLPFGAWWIFRNDNAGRPIRVGTFERAELAFATSFIQPGMTVLDLGAHHGLYTLLASKRVGSGGKVYAFEPSPRERRALRLHLVFNLCRNVVLQGLALGEEEAESDLYVVEDWAAGCNSLRPPNLAAKTSLVRVHVVRLDDWLAERKIDRVDFVKVDVEGAELGTLRGAAQLLERRPRPVILAEVQDLRTLPWGYPAKQIIDYLISKGFKWAGLSEDGALKELDVSSDKFDGNFVACPEESLSTLQRCREITSELQQMKR
jgi:FkbM family methyltransferase